MHNTYQKSFSSKLLLFGEYTVLNGSMSLAIPFAHFKLQLQNNGINNFSGIVKAFHDFLLKQDFSQWNIHFDANKYRKTFENGYYFKSDIPIGYGVGSSGSVTAAVYDLFFEKKDEITSLQVLKEVFSGIEAFFHGQSSGIDPLIIYTNHAILGKGDGSLEKKELDYNRFRGLCLFLLDSKISRSTGEFVEILRSKFKKDSIFQNDMAVLTQLNNQLITSIVDDSNKIHLYDKLQEISKIQFESMNEMIPSPIKEVWKKLLDDDEHVMKLCGAGGGGFFYIFSKNPTLLYSSLKQQTIINTGLFKNC